MNRIKKITVLVMMLFLAIPFVKAQVPTPPTVVNLPYYATFDDSDKWLLTGYYAETEDASTQWYIGIPDDEEDNMLFISNDGSNLQLNGMNWEGYDAFKGLNMGNSDSIRISFDASFGGCEGHCVDISLYLCKEILDDYDAEKINFPGSDDGSIYHTEGEQHYKIVIPNPNKNGICYLKASYWCGGDGDLYMTSGYIKNLKVEPVSSSSTPDPQPPAILASVDLPYISTFDDSDKWLLTGYYLGMNDAKNQWYKGIPNNETEKMLFVSKGDKTLTYDGTQESKYDAFKGLNMGSSDKIRISFDAKVGGTESGKAKISLYFINNSPSGENKIDILPTEASNTIYNTNQEQHFEIEMNNPNKYHVSYFNILWSNTNDGIDNEFSCYITNIKVEAVNSSTIDPYTEPTMPEAVNLPYISSFDDSDEWLLTGYYGISKENGPTKLYKGTPKDETEKMLFASQDGQTMTYTGAKSCSYDAYKPLNMGNSDKIRVSFDAKVGGDDDRKADITVYLSSNLYEEYPMPLEFENYQNGAIFNTNGEQHFDITISNPSKNKVAYLNFRWDNGGTLADGEFSAYIKNIKVEAVNNIPEPEPQQPELPTTVNLPYNSTFNENDEWLLTGYYFNGEKAVNKWYKNIPTGQTEKMLFISQDGTSLTYDGTEVSGYDAFKGLNMGTSDSIRISFDAKVGGKTEHNAHILFSMYNDAPNGEKHIKIPFKDYVDDEIFNTIEEKHFVSEIKNPNKNGVSYFNIYWWNDNKTAEGDFSCYIKNIKIEPIITQSLNDAENSLLLNIYPNPTKQNTIVSIDNIRGKAQLTVTDIQGKEVYKQNIFDGQNNIEIPSEKFPTGVYYIRLIGENTSIIQKLIKQ